MEKKRKKRSILSTLILIIALGVFCYSAYQLYLILSEYQKGDTEYQEILEDVIVEEVVEKTVDLTLDIFFEYPMMNEVMRIVKEENPMVIEQDFQMDCRIRLSIRASRMPRLRERYEQLALETGRIRIGKESDTQDEGS